MRQPVVKRAVIGALALFVVLGTSVRADWRTPIKGAEPIVSSVFKREDIDRPASILPMPGAKPMLPPRFQPMGYEVIEGPGPAVATPAPPPPATVEAKPALVEAKPTPAVSPSPFVWSLPLVDRRLTLEQRTADLEPELQDAVSRIEPMYDPTRLDGPDTTVEISISAGTAAMDNVFADHWRLASPDPNINLKADPIATAWQATGVLPCDNFSKNRPHGFGDLSLTALSTDDCRLLLQTEALRYDAVPPTPILIAPVSVPVFAAPLPGSRMSSQDFWAAQRARIQSIQSHLQDHWQAVRERVSEAGPRS